MRRPRSTLAVVSVLLGAAWPAVPAGADLAPDPPVLPPALELVGGEAASDSQEALAEGEALVGLFTIAKGVCAGGGVTSGSYFRMFDPGGGLVTNGSSPCGDKTFTPLTPGTDGGLSTSGHQPHPSAPFDAAGNGTNNKITQPEPFYGTRFSTATSPTDPQTGVGVPAPKVVAGESGKLSGDLRAFAAAWQSQHFNQGAPKPDGSTPGKTELPSGTLERSDGSYRLEWSSHIVGGPFNNFTGRWHLEGTFRAGVVAASQQSTVSGGSQSRSAAGSGSLANTGPAFPVPLGGVLLTAAILLWFLDAVWGKRRARR